MEQLMKPMTLTDLNTVLVYIRDHQRSAKFPNTPKYVQPHVDCRHIPSCDVSICCFAIDVRPWFKDFYTLDFRDSNPKGFDTFFEYVMDSIQ